MKKKWLLTLVSCLCALGLCSCSGVGLLRAAHRAAAADKDVYTLASDAACLEREGETFYISAQSVSAARRGAWVGTVERWLVVDGSGTVLGQTPVGDLEAAQLLAAEMPAQIVAYYHVYADAEEEDALLVEIDNVLHPLARQLPKTPFAPKVAEPEDAWTLAQDCRILVHGQTRYRVTQDAAAETDAYLGMLARTLVFDGETGLEIPKAELEAIEVTPGALSRQRRVQRTYGAVYGIPGSGDVAVEVDGELRVARREE